MGLRHGPASWRAPLGRGPGHGVGLQSGRTDHFVRDLLPGTARLWDVPTRRRRGLLPHRDHVVGAAFTPDNRMIATACWDGAARLWDTATGKLIGQPLRHQREVRAVAFSPSGKLLLTGSFDGTSRLWDVPAPVAGDLERISLWVQVLTGMELDGDGLFRMSDAAAWQRHRRRLQELGGPPLPEPSE